ncbi:MAG: T9SS type A sorting domain-containing protein [Bacteroidales bacterium]|nr:T9SS type A sorting domain-containing protein [Bacteroidales bacterium]
MKAVLSVLTLFISIYLSASVQFVENRGQVANIDGVVQTHFSFYADFGHGIAYFCNDHVEFYFYDVFEKERSEYSNEEEEAFLRGDYAIISKKTRVFRMDLDFLNANPNVQIYGEKESATYNNYYLPHCAEGILRNIDYGQIRYKDLYPGIDLVFYANNGNLKYDFILQPGADPNDIILQYSGADELKLGENGDLQIRTFFHELTDAAPVLFLEDGSMIESEYVLNDNKISFLIKDYNGSGLTIDPELSWSTYYNNNYSSDTWTIPAFTSTGEFFAVCYTYCSTYPTLNPGGSTYFDNTRDGSVDLVVHKFNANRSKVWATYYGGNNSDYLAGYTDYGKAIVVDNNDELWVAGNAASGSSIFPTYNPGGGAFYQTQSKLHGETSFMLKFANDGTRIWATVFQHENANTNSSGIRLNGLGTDGDKVYFTGQTYRSNSNDIPFRTLSGAYNNTTFVGAQDPFIGRFSNSCVLEWCSYFNSGNITKTSYKQGVDLHIDNSGNLLFIGRESQNSTYPDAWLKVNPGGAYVQAQNNGDQDVLIAKFNSSMQVYWSTAYGGNGQDIPSMIIADNVDNIIIVCRAAKSTNFPTYNPGGGAYYQASRNSSGTWGSDGFIMKFSPSGARQWATYYGGSGVDIETIFTGVGVDTYNEGNIYVIGRTGCTDFPTMSRTGSYNDNSLSGTSDIVGLMFDNDGVRFWATYLGGSGSESTYSSKCAVRVIGSTARIMAISYSNSANFPLVNPGGGALYETTKLTTNVNIIFEFTNTDITLPAELLDFTYDCTDEGLHFEWSSASESQCRDYQIQVQDGNEWETIAVIQAAGNSNIIQNYSYDLIESSGDQQYYRLLQTDFDGSETVLDLIPVYCSEHFDFMIFPNPTTQNLIIQDAGQGIDVENVHLYDVLGRELFLDKFLINNGVQVDVTVLEPGTYTVIVEFGANKLAKSFLKY